MKEETKTQEHKNFVHGAILSELKGFGIPKDKAKEIIAEIARGRVQYLTINY